MDRERWKQAKAIFDRAAGLPDEEREAFLEEQCGDDPALRRELESLLGCSSGTTFGDAVKSAFADLSETRLPQIPGYEILRRIGSGGMGEVFEAEQLEPVRRRVAVKVIRTGLDTERIIQRFASEQQVLAVMDHPAIARVYDAGRTERGRPYFTMELIGGPPITEYCDRHRLGTEARLDLFVQACEGVFHAHLKGVIHRDLKPSNVLVTEVEGKPVPKIIDFGVAKAVSQRLTERTLFTELGMLIGTPEYMSPEQAEAGAADVDVRSDVYSLGVMLYELLVGTVPLDLQELRASGWEAILRRIREEEAPRPSRRITTLGGAADDVAAKRHTNPTTLRRRIAGDLDWITAKALEKEPHRRYSSPQALADDIRRHLRHEPLEARPPDPLYRMRRFARRNRVAVSVTTAALITLIAYTTTTVVQSRRIDAARADAESRATELEQVVAFESEQIDGIDVPLMGERLRAGLLRKVRRAGELEGRSGDEIDARVREVERLVTDADFTGLALESLEENILQRSLDAIHEQFDDRPLIRAELLQSMASKYRKVGLYDESLAPQTEALEIRRHELGEDHPDTLDSLTELSVQVYNQGDYERAEPLKREALERSRRVLGEDHPETLNALANLGVLLVMTGRDEEGGQLVLEALEGRRRVLGDEHEKTLESMDTLGAVRGRQRRFDEAEAYLREALEIMRRVHGTDHKKTAAAINSLANVVSDQGKLEEAEALRREAFDIRRSVLGDDHPETLESLGNLGVIYEHQGNPAEAARYYGEAWERERRVLGEEHEYTLISLYNLGRMMRQLERYDEAERHLRASLAGFRDIFDEAHNLIRWNVRVLGLTLDGQGRSTVSEALQREHIAALRRLGPNATPALGEALTGFGEFLLRHGRPANAEPVLSEALRVREGLLAETDWRLYNLRSLLGGTMLAQGRLADAEPLLVESAEWLLSSEHVPRLQPILAYVEAAAQRVVDLYEARHDREPDRGFDTEAAAWRAKLARWSEAMDDARN